MVKVTKICSVLPSRSRPVHQKHPFQAVLEDRWKFTGEGPGVPCSQGGECGLQLICQDSTCTGGPSKVE